MFKGLSITKQSKDLFYPKNGWRWWIKISKGRYELLKLIVHSNYEHKIISSEDVFNIYKKFVSRNDDERKIKINFKNWLSRTVGALVLDGLLAISPRVDRKFLEDIQNSFCINLVRR